MTSTPETVRRLNRLENDSLATYELISGISRTQDKHTKQLTQIESKLSDHGARFDAIDTRFDAMDTRLDGIDTRLDGMDTRLDGIDTQLGGIDTQLGGIHTQLAELTSTLQTVVELVTPAR